MRKPAILFFMSLISVIAYSQAQIEGFWNLKLGEERNSVISKINRDYPNAQWNYKTYADKQSQNTKNASLVVRDAHLAGIGGSMSLEFSNEKLSNGTFTVGFRSAFLTSYQNVETYLQGKMREVSNYYDVFFTAFNEKYGEPYSQENGVLTWKSPNGNKIQIYKEYFIEDLPWGEYDGYIGLSISYILGITINDY